MTRWTKGTPAAKAPADTPLLVAFDHEGREPSYATMRVRYETTHYAGGPGSPDVAMTRQRWTYTDGRSCDFAPDRFWTLPA